MKKFKWYRKLIGGTWYLHRYNIRAESLGFEYGEEFWLTSRLSHLPRQYTQIIDMEDYTLSNQK